MTCCNCPSVTILDFKKEGDRITNRTCINCRAHWYGKGLAVKKYTGQQWDALVNSREAWKAEMGGGE